MEIVYIELPDGAWSPVTYLKYAAFVFWQFANEAMTTCFTVFLCQIGRLVLSVSMVTLHPLK